jgi:sugar-specific transcriptional regulator TrmB
LTIYLLFSILTTMVVNIVKQMQKLGFTEYESRSYAALLEENPVTAYELSKRSGIPSSKIYEVLGRLLEKEMAFELQEVKGKRYIPVQPERFMKNYSNRVKKTLGGLERDFSRLNGPPNVSYIINCDSFEDLIRRSEQLIASAQSSFLVSGWTDEISHFSELLSSRAGEGVKLAVVHFGKIDLPGVCCYEHPVEDILYREKGGRGLVMVVDSLEAITATIFEDGSIEAAWSRNSGFVSMADDYIRHDIYILKVVRHFGKKMGKTFGSRYAMLRNVFSDEVIS